MGDEDRGYTTQFIKVSLKVWMKAEIGSKYYINYKGVRLEGEVINKNPGELVVRFKLPRNTIG